MTNVRVRHLVLLLILGLAALFLLGAPPAAAENAESVEVRIDHFTHSGCVVDGKRLKPAFASDGGAASFWLPRQRQSCLDTIKRSLHVCERATSFATNTDAEKYPSCLSEFAAEAGSCRVHYELESGKCRQGPESQASSEQERQEFEEERERLALEAERERQALEGERERLALQAELERLEEEQRLAEERARELARQRRLERERELARQRELERERELARQRQQEWERQLAVQRRLEEEREERANMEAIGAAMMATEFIRQSQERLRRQMEQRREMENRRSAPAGPTYSSPTVTPSRPRYTPGRETECGRALRTGRGNATC